MASIMLSLKYGESRRKLIEECDELKITGNSTKAEAFQNVGQFES